LCISIDGLIVVPCPWNTCGVHEPCERFLSLDNLRHLIASKTASDPDFAVAIVDALLATSAAAGASDLHLLPTPAGLDLRWRIDGVLQPLGTIPPEQRRHADEGASAVAHLPDGRIEDSV
jgi:hypothetical protein